MNKRIRVLIAKPGLDGHDRGALVIAQGLRDEGMEVIYSGLRQTPEQIVATAIQEDVDCIGLSILSGAHNELFPEVTKLLKAQDADDILLIGGGVIPDEDIPFLKENGVNEIFTSGTPISEIANYIKRTLSNRLENDKNLIKGVNHIGIAVNNLEQSMVFFRDILKLKFSGIEEVESEGVRVAFFEAGEVKIELLEPINNESPIFKHLQTRGEGFHHIAFDVEDIQSTFQQMESNNITLLQKQPKVGANGNKIGFIHPKDSNKVLMEFISISNKQQ